jgi:hypothetical protein
MTYAEVKEQALRHVAAWLRDSPTEGALWEGVVGSGLDSFQPDDAGRRSALQFTRALEEIAGDLEARADAMHERAAAPFRARVAAEHERAAIWYAEHPEGAQP